MVLTCLPKIPDEQSDQSVLTGHTCPKNHNNFYHVIPALADWAINVHLTLRAAIANWPMKELGHDCNLGFIIH